MSILKKFAFLLAVCAVVSFSHFNIAFAYPDYVAIISNYHDVKNGIQIHRKHGSPPTGSEALLYPGDIITGNVGYVLIERGPYADYHAVDGYYVISYDPPSAAVEFAEKFFKQTSLFKENVNAILRKHGEGRDTAIAKRAASSSKLKASYGFDLKPQPGFNPTLIRDEKVCFAGVIKIDKKTNKSIMPKSYVIKDGSGQEVYSGVFNKAGEAELDLSSQNLQVGEKYTWLVDYAYVVEGSKEYDFTILDEEITQMIKDCFAKIDAKKVSSEQRTLEKAFWVQKISDDSDGKIDLYWLSAQLLTSISPKSEENMLEKYRMLERYNEHLLEESDRYSAGE